MSHRSVPAPFLTKTYQLVDDRSTDNVVSWNEKGTAFVVWKMDDFSKDLLPAYFKHNNFSSFVRQLNTYGFHKTVPDKWEFSNDNFKRGHKNLLTQIRRRKSITAPSPTQDGVKSCGVAAVSRPKSPSISGECLGSGSISTSSSSKNPASVQTSNTGKFDEIVKENEKLKMENEKLSSELAQTKKELDKLIVVLSQHATVGPSEVMSLVSSPDVHVHDDDMECLVVEKNECEDDDDDNDNVKNGECARVKLFGVWLKENKKKRGGDKISDFCGPAKKSYGGPWKNLVGHPNDNIIKLCN